jgi:uncharacterized cupredoxin-like copper-binding protein
MKRVAPRLRLGTLELVDLNEPGTYEMYCPVSNHREMGMEGEITVK